VGTRLRLGVLTDLHVAEPGTPDQTWINTLPLGRSRDLLRAALDRLANLDVDALLLLGDLTQDGTEAQFAIVQAELAGFPAPWWSVLGNHDLAQDGSTGPVDEHLRCVHLASGSLTRAEGAFREASSPDLIRWPDGPALWLTHFPLVDLRPDLAAVGLPHAGDLTNRAEALSALLARPGPTIALAGHLHVRAATSAGPLLHLSHAALIEPPHELTVLEVHPAEVGVRVERTAYALTPDAPPDRSPALAPARQAWFFKRGWEELPGL
jgi:predicted MPP superfamily phosphohydrolase